MEREIKFRGKRIDTNEWVIGSLIIKSARYGSFWYIYVKAIEEDAYDKEYQVHPESVGQFTGLHDKSGKEIYEDDIIQFIGVSGIIIGVVNYEQQACAYWIRWKRGASRYKELIALSGGSSYENNSVEIIGNIYENENLIK